MTFKKIRLVFFDVGGTLLTSPSFAELLEASLADLNQSVDRRLLCASIDFWRGRIEGESSARNGQPSRGSDRRWWREAAEGVFRACGLAEDLAQRGGRRFLARNGARGSCRAFSDVAPCLRALRSKALPMAVLSNWSWDLPELLQGLEWEGFFDPIVVSSRVGWRKPHSEIFRIAREGLSLAPHELLLVGDRIDADVEAAKKAGWEAILLDRRQALPVVQRRLPGNEAFLSISSLDLLPEILSS